MEPTKTTFKHPGDLDSEIWEWLKEHGTEETKQVIMMTARHFAGFMTAPKQEQSSLPSNLNEAAMQFARRAYSPFDDPYEVSKAFENDVNCFKAGAKWMAGQGYTQEGIAHLDDHEVWVDIKNTDIKDGDKVIVQIRRMTNK